ncbi:MAG: alpha/beta hydrolase [Polyangiaceae bacterium]
MTLSYVYLGAAVVAVLFGVNAHRPIYRPATLSVLSFFAGWLTSELALYHLLFQAGGALVFIGLGALSAWPGWVASALVLASMALLVASQRQAVRAGEIVESALARDLGPDFGESVAIEVSPRKNPIFSMTLPLVVRPRDIERIRDIVYTSGPNYRMKLDLYHRPVEGTDQPRRPVVLEIHGGAWILGSKNEQGLPLLYHLAKKGYVCISVDYRLSPRATFPDPLVDIKRAIAWVRDNADRYGMDPDFIVLTGGSAGGHLSSLAALTANDPEYQPGFEGVDTSVAGCIPFYGVYDFTDRHGHYRNGGLIDLVERHVIKRPLAEARAEFDRASPLSRAHADAPPFFILHGDRDTLAPVEDARAFADALRRAGAKRVAFAELAGAQHAFEIFHSVRTEAVIAAVEKFLTWLRKEHAAKSAGAQPVASEDFGSEVEPAAASLKQAS